MSHLFAMGCWGKKSARRIAAGRGLRVTGTLGVLCAAAARGLVELAPAIDRLIKNELPVLSHVAEGGSRPW